MSEARALGLWGKRYTHEKTGKTYTIDCILECNFKLSEGDDFVFEDLDGIHYAEVQNSLDYPVQWVVVYYGSDDYLWAREYKEFMERFNAEV